MKRILWIDDDANKSRPLFERLELEGSYQIQTMGSVDEALEHMEDLREYDLIVLDILLPFRGNPDPTNKYRGLAVLEAMKRQGVSTPVIVLSVVGDSRKKVLHDYKVKSYLKKPLKPSDLQAAVEEVLGTGK